MYLLALGWLYVALMMALVEASSSQGSVLGAVFTFLLYGLLPVGLLLYLMATPQRRAARRRAEAADMAAAAADTEAGRAASAQPDGGDHAATGGAIEALAPERKEA